MVEKPIVDTEPRVQRLYYGSHWETGVRSQDLADAGFCAFHRILR